MRNECIDCTPGRRLRKIIETTEVAQTRGWAETALKDTCADCELAREKLGEE